MRALDDAEARAAAASMAAEVERITESEPDRLRAHFDECLRTLDRQRTGAAQDAPDAPETDTSLDPRIRRIELLRNAHSAHGGNQSAVPRPVV
jgi:hypothetical protein